CPNPTCVHMFSPEVVRGAASLVCPRCGTTFQFNGQAATAAPPPASDVPDWLTDLASPASLQPKPRSTVPIAPAAHPPAPAVAPPVTQPVLASVPSAPVIPVAMPVAPVTKEEAETNLAFEAAPHELVAAPRRTRGRRRPWKAIVVVLLLSFG